MVYKYVIVLLLSICLLNRAYGELRDPTRPADYSQKAGGVTEALHLDAVLISADRKIAVINGQNLGMGEQVGGNYIVDIQPNAVQLEGPSGRMELLLFGKPVKQESIKSN